jgi:hypothetical protein
MCGARAAHNRMLPGRLDPVGPVVHLAKLTATARFRLTASHSSVPHRVYCSSCGVRILFLGRRELCLLGLLHGLRSMLSSLYDLLQALWNALHV